MKLKQLSDLKRRFLVSFSCSVIVVFLIAFSALSWVSMLLALTIALIAAIGVWEYGKLISTKGLKPHISLMVVVAICEVVAFFLSFKFFDIPLLPWVILYMGLIAFFLSHFKDASNTLFLVAAEFFSICYIAVPLSFLLGILYPAAHHSIVQDGRWWLLYLIVVTKVTDVGAYFVGRLWGKRQLAPLLSPKKTIEGALAGLVCALLVGFLMSYLGKKSSQGSFDLAIGESLWLSALLSISGQIGDLAESLFKRDAAVKDSNRLPGLGGILDMIDSLLITTPILYFFLRMH
jgi:phosphatidate cytidylyltransferase